jgi:hypothetical protein
VFDEERLRELGHAERLRLIRALVATVPYCIQRIGSLMPLDMANPDHWLSAPEPKGEVGGDTRAPPGRLGAGRGPGLRWWCVRRWR